MKIENAATPRPINEMTFERARFRINICFTAPPWAKILSYLIRPDEESRLSLSRVAFCVRLGSIFSAVKFGTCASAFLTASRIKRQGTPVFSKCSGDLQSKLLLLPGESCNKEMVGHMHVAISIICAQQNPCWGRAESPSTVIHEEPADLTVDLVLTSSLRHRTVQ